MSKMFQVYGIGQALIPVLPPPLHFENAPNSNQTNYEIGQVVYTGVPGAYAFYVYAGAGVWDLLIGASGALDSLTTSDSTVVVPTAGNINLLGVGSITTVGSGSSATVELTGLTNHAVLVGAGTTTITKLAVGATGQTLMGATAADPAWTGSPSFSGSVTAATTITATSGAITATNGNFVGTAVGTGILLNSSQASGAASGPVVVNGRSGRATFTSVSIAAAADLTLTITNSAITGSTTEVLLDMSGATTGAALCVKSKTASAGSLAIVVTNGTGATTSTADIQIDFLVLNA